VLIELHIFFVNSIFVQFKAYFLKYQENFDILFTFLLVQDLAYYILVYRLLLRNFCFICLFKSSYNLYIIFIFCRNETHNK